MDQKLVPKFTSFKKKPASKNASARHERDETSRRSHVQAYAQTSVSNSIVQREGDRTQASDNGNGLRITTCDLNVSKTLAPRASISGNKIPDSQDSDLFLVDKRGDPQNVTFEKIHKYDIPDYTRSGRGRIIGSPLLKIDLAASTDRNISLTRGSHSNQRAHTKLLSSKKGRTSESPTRLAVRAIDGGQNDEDCDYVGLSPSQWLCPDVASNLCQNAEQDDIQLGSKIDNTPFQVHRTIGHNTELSNSANINPNNVDLWLELADHQRHLIRPNTDVSHFTQSERRSLAELRTAVLSKALKKIDIHSPERDRIYFDYMFEGRQIWDRAKTLSKWNEALFSQKVCPASAGLWISYLDHVQQDHVAFDFDDCKSEFIRCLRKLKAAHRDSNRVELAQVDIFLQYTRFLRDSGYNELAIAHWQLVLEYHFFLPEQLATASWEDQRSALESFWESDQPRIGETNAEGWNVGLSQGSGFKRHQETRYPCESGALPSRRAAALAELNLSDDFWLPACIVDDHTDDPFRHVMFADLNDALDALIACIPRNDLLNAFLQFVGLPRLPLDLGYDLSSSHWKPMPAHCGTLGCFNSSPATRPGKNDSEQLKVRFQEETDSSLFIGNAFGATYDQASVHPSQGKDLVRYVDRTLAMLASTNHCSDALAIYHIAYKVKFTPKEAIKTAKAYVYRRSSGLRLPNAYALAEAVQGKKDKADRLWTAALQNRSRIPSGEEDMIAVLQTALKFYLDIDEESGALRILSTVYGDGLGEQQLSVDQATSRVLYLRAEQELQQGLDRMVLRGDWLRAVMHADSLAMLAYMFNGHDLDRSLAVYHAFDTQRVKGSHKTILEIMFQNKTALISVHLIRQRSFKMATIEEFLEQSLKQFPNNSMLVATFSKIISHDRIRAVLKRSRLSMAASESVVGISHTIANEMQRSSVLLMSANTHAVRSAFATALLKPDSTSGCSPFLWFRWFEFEADQSRSGDEYESSRAQLKDVFFHGMRYIPWVKSWAVTGMALLTNDLSCEQTTQIHDLLVRRGLRLRSSLTWESSVS